MKGRNNDFSMTFFYQGQRTLYLKYVHNTERTLKWVFDKGIYWDTCVIYRRKTGERLQVLKNQQVEALYSVTFVNENVRVLYLSDVPNVSNAIAWAFSKGFQFTYVNVYNKFTRNFIERIYI